jgi:hypothetical protein
MSYFGHDAELRQVIGEVMMLASGGTLAVMLANYALSYGYEAVIYSYNLQTFDPTWFQGNHDLQERLARQRELKPNKRLQISTAAHLEFLRAGGEIRFEDLSRELLLRHLRAGEPLIAGLSATYLYRCARETADDYPDDLRGQSTGHFVVISGYDASERVVEIADPYLPHMGVAHVRSEVSFERLICSILLGVLTYDANLLVVRPRDKHI